MAVLDRSSSKPRWADAAGVLALVVTMILTARQLRPLTEAGAFLLRTGETLSVVPVWAWPRAAAWVAISVAVLFRARTAAVLGAWAAVLYEIVVVMLRINGDPRYDVPFDLLVWPLLLAIAAAFLLTLSARAPHGLDLLGRHGRRLLAAAATVTTLTAVAIPILGDYHPPPPADSIDRGFHASFVFPSQLADAVAGATFAVVLALALAAVSGVDRAVRPRVYALSGAGIAGFVAIQLGLPQPFGLSIVPAPSRPTQAVVLVIGPGLVLGAGLLLIRFSERHRPTVDGIDRRKDPSWTSATG
ncbi:hypothetical protein GA0070624_4621 [Micromonospora rhizosphaerae]|uniref:Uncharacterized protein n=1 Tax=Micromonospora rhizosphaerae TaxID=568872 RepID=A0A1C6SU60_9ACTN|nr:hypothetical protein [Micromonospora rhizosphaerae]SCL32998.1 hypothetical protein GA0070624_4621 [Micromonospora rhizosphaerae]